MSEFSIGQNINNTGGLANLGTGSAVAAGGGSSVWTALGDIIPSLAQSGFALLANNRNARAQETIAKQQGGFLGQYFPGMYGNTTLQPRNNNMVWIVLAIVAAVVLFFIFRKK